MTPEELRDCIVGGTTALLSTADPNGGLKGILDYNCVIVNTTPFTIETHPNTPQQLLALGNPVLLKRPGNHCFTQTEQVLVSNAVKAGRYQVLLYEHRGKLILEISEEVDGTDTERKKYYRLKKKTVKELQDTYTHNPNERIVFEEQR